MDVSYYSLSSAIVVVAFVCGFVFDLSHSITYSCNTAYSCANETIIQSIANHNNITGYGYKSNYGQASSVVTGAFTFGGAYSAQYMKSAVAGGNEIICGGFKSCDYVQFLNNTEGNILFCEGSTSCANIRDVKAVDVACTDDYSCANSYFSDAYVVDAWSAYSLYNAYFNISERTQNTTFYFGGYYAGLNTTVVCRNDGANNGINCDINCYGNGCFGLKLICATASCAEFNVVCDDCEVYPSFLFSNMTFITDNYNGNNKYNNDLHLMNQLNIMEIGEELNNECDNNLDSTQDDYYIGVHYFGITDSSDSSVICCRGFASCIYASFALPTSDPGAVYNIICSGWYTCYQTDISTLTGNSNMWCITTRSCYDSDISSTIGSSIGDYNSTVYCAGFQACAFSDIDSVSSLYATARSAASSSSIYGVANIYVYGGVAPLDSAQIYSDGVGIMNIYFDSYDAGYNVFINCESGDKCFIRCLTTGACSDSTKLNCMGLCVVDCGDSLGCPEVIAPTSAPTDLPTVSGMYCTLILVFFWLNFGYAWTGVPPTILCSLHSFSKLLS